MPSRRFIVCAAALGVHLVCGVAWYCVYLGTPNVMGAWW
jgi:hypothetical protein